MSPDKNDEIVLAIDPGYDRLGVAVIRESAGKSSLLFSDCVVTDKKNPHEKRLAIVGSEISKLIKTWRPNAVAVEELFFSKNQKTALLVSQALGVIIYEASKSGAKVFYYKPIQVKIAVTGYGKSDKNHVTSMVGRLIEMDNKKSDKKRHDDEYDAIAVGLTHIASRRRNTVGF
ncbi:MAG: crossover junction endodeoxyribonuclease RuvC [Patescibacteria group bacterium]